MIKKLIIFIVVVLLIWFIAIYFNQNNQTEEIIIGDEINTENVEEGISEVIEESTEAIGQIKTLAEKAKTYCSQTNIGQVYVSDDKIKVVSSLPGAGSIYLTADGTSSFTCPVVAPDSMTEDCKAIMEMGENAWAEVCPGE